MSEPRDDESPGVYPMEPIGFVRSPHHEKADAPRQPRAAAGIEGTIELRPDRGYEDALSDLALWRYIWVVFVFDRAVGWRPKVRPPRSDRKRGVFGTRAPHRPNPIGLSVLELVGVEGLAVRVRDVDLLDGTPVLDIKPYVAWTDAIPEASGGWLPRPADPAETWTVRFAPRAEEQLAFLAGHGVDLRRRVADHLALGPRPHAYRRIRERDGGFELSVKSWRVDFHVAGAEVVVERLRSGVSPRDRFRHPEKHSAHVVFAARFPS